MLRGARRRGNSAPARTSSLGGRSAPAGAAAHLTVRVPFMPACSCPGTEQKKVYFPGLTSTEIVETFPPEMTGPFWFTPLPWRETLCGVLDLFCESISSLPEGVVAAPTR